MGQRRRIAAYGVCPDAAGRVLLVPAAAGAWRLPGGGVEHGEQPEAAVVRLVAATTGVQVRVTGVRDVLSDQLELPGGGVVHHDRVVFDLAGSGSPSDGARWFAPDELSGAVLLPYTAAVLGLPAVAGAEAEPDEGWAVDRGLAVDDAGERPRVQRFAVYALATDPAGRVLLTQIARGYPGAGRWHLPGGGTDVGESAAEGLLRELWEETGQRGRVVGLIGVSHRHNPAAIGWEGYPIDWHTVRVIYRVAVDAPTAPRVIEAGGSTARAAWFVPERIDRTRLTEVAANVWADADVAMGRTPPE